MDVLAAGIDKIAHFKEEGHVPDVVQAKRNQQTLDETIHGGGSARVAHGSPLREGLDGAADGRPDEGQYCTQHDGSHGGDNGHKALAGKEAQVLRQADAVVLVEHVCRQATGQNAAEHTGLDGWHAHDGVGFHAQQPGHHAQRGGHHQEADGGGNGGHTVVFGKAQRHAHGKDQRQVAENHVTGVFHQRQDGQQHGALGVEVGCTNAQQQAGYRQYGNGQHQCLADFLQKSEGLIKHDSDSCVMLPSGSTGREPAPSGESRTAGWSRLARLLCQMGAYFSHRAQCQHLLGQRTAFVHAPARQCGLDAGHCRGAD